MLDDTQILAIEYLAEGKKTKVEIAELIGKSRQTIYNYLDNEEFVAELDKRIQQRKNLVEKIMDSRLEKMVEQVETLAVTTKNDMVKSQILRWWIEMGIGKATSKHELVLDNTQLFSTSQNEIKDVFDQIEDDEDDTTQ